MSMFISNDHHNKVLLVTKNKKKFDLLLSHMKTYGNKVKVTHDEISSLNAVRHFQPDLILIHDSNGIDTHNLCSLFTQKDEANHQAVVTLSETPRKHHIENTLHDIRIYDTLNEADLLSNINLCLKCVDHIQGKSHIQHHNNQNTYETANRLTERHDELSTQEANACFKHEISQPLTAIYNYSQAGLNLLEQKPPNLSRLIPNMEKIAVQTTRASKLVNRFWETSTKTDIILESLNTNNLLRETITLAETDINLHNNITRLNLKSNIPNILGDSLQLQQVLLNLIRNAVESMTECTPERKHITIKNEYINNAFVRISIIDQGEGLSADAERNLFKPFHTTKQHGTGLGLSISQRIIIRHGGELNYTTVAGSGSTFWFTVPVAAN